MNTILPFQCVSDDTPPSMLLGYVSVQGPESVFTRSTRKLSKSAKAFHGSKQDRESVRKELEKSGFKILSASMLGFSVAAPPAAFEDLTGGKVSMVERLLQAETNRRRYVTHADITGPSQPETVSIGKVKSKSIRIDGVLLERPRMCHGIFPSPIPPNIERFHLRVPDDVATGLGAQSAHRQGHVGAGVTVVMPDSGHYRHPYFTAHGYALKTAITVVPGTDAANDPVGHGTGESANIFAVAPGAEVQPIRASNDAGQLVGAISAFLKAKELAPAIITNSWGGDGPFPPDGGLDEYDKAWALEIQDAIEQGMLVVFSAGNGQFSVEPQVPGVLAAGGVYMDESLELSASNYASAYESPWFTGVSVPTVCGLVGLIPRAQYLLLPLAPGCEIDDSESRPVPGWDPNTDDTASDDGWALFSGTSAAAPQVAGAAALILGAKPKLKPAQVVEALSQTAVDITSGYCNERFNLPAAVGHDQATGSGLVNASAAVQYALDHF